MKLFQVVAAKNNQKVNLSVQHATIEEARSSLHIQGYSIIEIQERWGESELSQESKSQNKLFYFQVKSGAESKKGQIYAPDILRAYKKLTDGLSYTVESLYENIDSTEDERAYVTAKVKEVYFESKKYSKITEPVLETSWDKNNTVPKGPLQREVERYQWLIEKICLKIENLITHQKDSFPLDQLERLAKLLIALKQSKQGTNIDKLKLIGEAALLKIGQLEIEIQGDALEQRKAEFIKETNSLLKWVGSSKRVGGSWESFKNKITTLLGEIFPKDQEVQPWVEKADKDTFTYYKNARELSIYEERLSLVKREIRKLFFSSGEKKERLRLKKRLLEQNILITRSRVLGKTFSYSRVVKGVTYYSEILLVWIRWIAHFTQYIVAWVTLSLCLHAIFNPGLPEKIITILLFFSVLTLFGNLFRKVDKLSALLGVSTLFAFMTTILLVNF